jgi:hypothetical protein
MSIKSNVSDVKKFLAMTYNVIVCLPHLFIFFSMCYFRCVAQSVVVNNETECREKGHGEDEKAVKQPWTCFFL